MLIAQLAVMTIALGAWTSNEFDDKPDDKEKKSRLVKDSNENVFGVVIADDYQDLSIPNAKQKSIDQLVFATSKIDAGLIQYVKKWTDAGLISEDPGVEFYLQKTTAEDLKEVLDLLKPNWLFLSVFEEKGKAEELLGPLRKVLSQADHKFPLLSLTCAPENKLLDAVPLELFNYVGITFERKKGKEPHKVNFERFLGRMHKSNTILHMTVGRSFEDSKTRLRECFDSVDLEWIAKKYGLTIRSYPGTLTLAGIYPEMYFDKDDNQELDTLIIRWESEKKKDKSDSDGR